MLNLTGCIGLSVIELVGHRMCPNATCMFDESVSVIPIDYNWALLLIILRGTGSIVSTLTTLKFLIAQSPHQMKRLTTKQLLLCIQWNYKSANLYRPLNKLLCHTTPSSRSYYYLAQSIILIFVLILFTIVSKWYKLRAEVTLLLST